jgi:hypothetical protein
MFLELLQRLKIPKNEPAVHVYGNCYEELLPKENTRASYGGVSCVELANYATNARTHLASHHCLCALCHYFRVEKVALPSYNHIVNLTSTTS